MDKLFLKPKLGVLVRNADKPHAPHIKADGEWLIPTQYILRRLRDGDLIRVAPPDRTQQAPQAPRREAREKKD